MIYLLTGEEEIDARNDEGIEQSEDWSRNHESNALHYEIQCGNTDIRFPRDIFKCRASDHDDDEIEDPITCL